MVTKSNRLDSVAARLNYLEQKVDSAPAGGIDPAETVAALEAAQAEADAARARTSVTERAILETAPEDDGPVATVLEVLRKHRFGGVDD